MVKREALGTWIPVVWGAYNCIAERGEWSSWTPPGVRMLRLVWRCTSRGFFSIPFWPTLHALLELKLPGKYTDISSLALETSRPERSYLGNSEKSPYQSYSDKVFYNYKKIMLNVVFHSFLSWSCGGVEDVVVLILWSQLIITYLPWYLLKIFIFSKYQALVFVIILLSVRPFILFRLVIWVSLANLGIFSWMLKWNGLAPDYM